MTSNDFPCTKSMFDKWWNGKQDRKYTDSWVFPRSQTCPIARFLKTLGYKDVNIRTRTWQTNSHGPNRSLPVWAQNYVRKFDTTG